MDAGEIDNRFAAAAGAFRGMFWCVFWVLFAPPVGIIAQFLPESRTVLLLLGAAQLAFMLGLLGLQWVLASRLIPFSRDGKWVRRIRSTRNWFAVAAGAHLGLVLGVLLVTVPRLHAMLVGGAILLVVSILIALLGLFAAYYRLAQACRTVAGFCRSWTLQKAAERAKLALSLYYLPLLALMTTWPFLMGVLRSWVFWAVVQGLMALLGLHCLVRLLFMLRVATKTLRQAAAYQVPPAPAPSAGEQPAPRPVTPAPPP